MRARSTTTGTTSSTSWNNPTVDTGIETCYNVGIVNNKERTMKYACWSVVGGWVTASVNAEGEPIEFIGPVFNSITDLWKWQRANLYTEMA